jgi:dolichol-phosphate mannosyltransferase
VLAQRWRFVKFCLVGGSGVLVNLAVVWLANDVLFAALGVWWRTSLAYLAGIVVSIFTNFLLNDAWTWKDRRHGGAAAWLARMGKYYAVSAVAAVLQYVTSLGATALAAWLLTGSLRAEVAIWYKWLAVMAGVAVGTLVNFAVNHLWTYRDPAGGKVS